MTAHAMPGNMKRRLSQPFFDHLCGSKGRRDCRCGRPKKLVSAGSLRIRSSHTVSGMKAACMHSKSHVDAHFGKPGMKSVGKTGCVWLEERLSSWKHSPESAPFGPLAFRSIGPSSFCKQRSGSG